MRVLCLFLLFANLVYFAAERGDVKLFGSRQREPQRMAAQIAPEAVRILAPAAVAQLEASARQPAAAPAQACLEVGGYAADETARVEGALGGLGLGAALTTRKAEEPTSFMVYIPPQGSMDAAQRKLEELRRLGVTDYAILQDNGPLRFGVSLGVFRSEESAQKRLAELAAQGVRTARAGPRPGGRTLTWYQVRNVDAALKARLDQLDAVLAPHAWEPCPA